MEETLVFPATVGGPWDKWIPRSPLPSVGEGPGVRGNGAGQEATTMRANPASSASNSAPSDDTSPANSATASSDCATPNPLTPSPLPTGVGRGAPEVAEAHYVRRVARPGARAKVAARTLTRLYNERPAWLRHAHEKLDAAVAAAYGIDPHIPEPDLLAFLLKLNLIRSSGT